jgi:hypothetical protein
MVQNRKQLARRLDMRRFLQVLTLGAAALLFTAASPGIAAADHGRGGGQGGNYQGSRPYEPYYKPYKGYKKYGQHRRHKKRHYAEKRRRHHYREHRRYHRHDHFRHGHKHRHHGRRHHRHGHEYGFWPYIGLHFYPSAGHAERIEAAPPAYPARPPAYPVQPAVVEQQVADAGPPSTCLMTREYQTEIVVGGELVPAYGQACLQPDGSWYRGPAVPEGY